MNTKEKKVLRFLDDNSIISVEDKSSIPFDEITLRSSIGSPIAASSVARPFLPLPHRDGQDLEDSHAQLFRQLSNTMKGAAASQENGDAVPDSARSRVSFAPSDMTDTSLGILNLDDLASGLEELDDDFMDLSQDLQSPRSGTGDGEEMATPQPAFPPSSHPRDGNMSGMMVGTSQPPFPSSDPGNRSTMMVSQMSAPSIMFYDSQEDQEDDDKGIASDFSDGQPTPVPAHAMRSRTQGSEGGRSSEIDTEDEINAVRQENAQTRLYAPDPSDRLGVGESRDDDDDERNQRFNGSRDMLLDNQVSRLQLDGGSSEDDNQRIPITEPRQSAEGEVVILDPGDGGGGGDGMSDGETTSSGLPDAPVTFGQSTLMAFQGQGANRSSRDWTMTSGIGAVDPPAVVRRFPDADEDADDEDDDDDNGAPHMEIFSGQSRIQPIGETDIWQKGAGSMNFSSKASFPRDSSTNFDKRFNEDFSGASNMNGVGASMFGDGVQNPFDSGPLPDQNGLPMTDLGFGSGEEFIAEDDAMAMIDKDQEECERENIFRQDETMSHDLGDDVQSGWELPNGGHMTLRQSISQSAAVAWDDEKSYNHSAEMLFAMRSEALGSLSGNGGGDKPHFGDGTIISPPPVPAYPLINRSMILSHHDEEDIFPASQREAGVGQNTLDASRSSQSLHTPYVAGESSNGTGGHRFGQEIRQEEKPGNRSGVYVPTKTLSFPFGQKKTEKMEKVDESVSESLVDDLPEGYQTPPMDLSMLTAAIAQHSATDSQQLAKLILSASNKMHAFKEKAQRKATKEDGVKTRLSKTRKVDSLGPRLGETKTNEQPDTTSQSRETAGNKAYRENDEHLNPSSMNIRPKLSGYIDLSERMSLDGSGGSGEQSRSSISSRGSKEIDEHQSMDRNRDSYEKCNRSLSKEELRESHLGDDYFAEITRERLPIRGMDISDTIDFQDLENGDDELMKSQSRMSVTSSQDKLTDLESQRNVGMVEDSQKIHKKAISDENVRQLDRSSRSGELLKLSHDFASIRNADIYPKVEDCGQGINRLQQKHKLSAAPDRKNLPLNENIAPLKSQSIPVVSKNRRSRDNVESSKSHTQLVPQVAFPQNDFSKEKISRDFVYSPPRRKDSGQGQMVEPRSHSIPDGESTEVEPIVARTPAATGQNLEDQMQMLSVSQQKSKSTSPRELEKKTSPKGVPVSDESNHSIQRSSIYGSSCRPKESLRQRRKIDGASSGKIVPSKTSSRDDEVFKRPDVPVVPQGSRSVSASIHETLINKGLRLPEGFVDMEDGREVNVSRFSIDSQADIICGKHRIVQTPRERRTNNAPSRQRMEGVPPGEGKDVDAEVDSGFSSEQPHRLPNLGNAPQLTVSNVAHVQEMWKGSQELPVTFDDIEGSHNFSAIKTEISPVASPMQSPRQSPVGPSKQNTSAESDAEKTLLVHSTNRTLVAETPELISPRSSGSSRSHSIASSMNRSASSGSDRSCSTPKRISKQESDDTKKGLENPPNYAGTRHLAPPPYHQPYTSTASSAPSIPDPTRRPVLPSYLEQPTFYTNQALSETNFLQHYVNDRPVSKLSSTDISSLHETLQQPRSASHLGIPMGTQQAGLYPLPATHLPLNLYGAPHGLVVTGSGATSMYSAPYTARLGGHQQQRRVRSRSVEPHSINPSPWPGYHMLDTQNSGAAGLLETAVHSGPTVPVPSLGHPSGPPASIVSNLIVPFEHRFRDVACIGIAAQDSIELQNPSSRWLQCFLEVVSLSINGEEVDHPSRVFFMKPRIIIGPNTTEKHKITFAPRQPGIHEAKIQVGSSPVVADSEAGLLRVTAPPIMTLRAVAELPEIEVEGAVKGTVDLGEIVFGMERSKTVHLINRGRSSLPVRLFFVNKMVAMWYTATITAENGQDLCTSAAPARPLHLTLPGHSTTTIDGEVMQPPSSITVKLTTQRSEPHLKAASHGPPENIHLCLKVELDVPERTVSLAEVDLCARVGVAKLHLPDSLAQGAFLFKSTVGQTSSRNLLFKNAGNIRLDMRLRIPRGIDSFEVIPDTLVIEPSQQRDILVRFTPKEQMAVIDVPLFIQGKPDGPNYEVQLRGEIETSQQRVKRKPQTAQVLCNKKCLAFGGIPLGKSLMKSATLRNPTNEIVSLKLTIQDSEDFQLQSSHGNLKKLSSSYQVVIKPKQNLPVDVVFNPSQLSSCKGSLDVKPIHGSTKYLVPLSGYGGVSNLVLEDANLRGDTYLHDFGPLTPGQHTVLTFKVRNTGLRAAFVKALCFKDSRAKLKLPSSHLNVEPSEFVISPKMSKTLTVIFSPKEDDIQDALQTQEVAAVGLFYGDEVLRKLLQRLKPSEMTSCQAGLSPDNPLRGVSFDVRFLGEEHCKEKFDLEPGSNIWSLFYMNMSRVLLSLTGRLGRKERSPRKDRSPHKDRSPTHAVSSVAPLPAQAQAAVKVKKEQTPHGIVLGQDRLTFDLTSQGQAKRLTLMCKNTGREAQSVEFLNPEPPFYIQHHTHTIRAKHYVKVPISYKPKSPGKHQSFMVIHTQTRHSLVAELNGECR
ncbi:uncharacterized protein LOC121408319 [Lytechinus variegatus]|uniref:uncharacterized protein LOC121408319 n=1 Tax=Lytechinus variegatus TaxID=7654 RepID=UPI001BB23CF3|nr:uncharacterized protein LOC121408319 [Lytechinus variegatus]XP_041455678.1 uncharacterized protein LOC121408319 [Lytechinus variegatus]